MIAYQVTAALIGISIGGLILWLVRKNHLHGPYAIWWMVVAFSAIALGLYPEVVNPIARVLGVFYPPLLAVILALAAVLAKALSLDLERTRQENRLRALTQRVIELEQNHDRWSSTPPAAAIFDTFVGERVLHIGKGPLGSPGGIEKYLTDVFRLGRRSQNLGVLVHKNHEKIFGRLPYRDAFEENVFVASSYGSLFHAPISPFFFRVLENAIKEFRPTVLHIHVPNTSAFYCLFSKQARQLKWVLHWHADVDPWGLDWRMQVLYPLYRPFETALLRRADTIIVTSRQYLEASEPLTKWRHKCRVIPLGLDQARMLPPSSNAQNEANSLWPNSRLIKLVAVGRLAYYKGYDVLLGAVARLPHTQLVIVGVGQEHDRLLRRVQHLGLRNRVALVGYRDDEVIHALLRTAEALCVPSVDRSEAFGLALLEGMSFGCPIVASDIPGSGIRWVASHAPDVAFVNPNDVDSLVAALKRRQQGRDLEKDRDSTVTLPRNFSLTN